MIRFKGSIYRWLRLIKWTDLKMLDALRATVMDPVKIVKPLE
jgi:hypothetical protein